MSRESEELPEPELGVWYYDRRNHKFYTPSRVDGDTVHLVSVWHRDEFGTALREGEMLPLDMETGIPGGIGPDYTKEKDTAFNVIDSFRFLDEDRLRCYYEAGEDE